MTVTEYSYLISLFLGACTVVCFALGVVAAK